MNTALFPKSVTTVVCTLLALLGFTACVFSVFVFSEQLQVLTFKELCFKIPFKGFFLICVLHCT